MSVEWQTDEREGKRDYNQTDIALQAMLAFRTRIEHA